MNVIRRLLFLTRMEENPSRFENRVWNKKCARVYSTVRLNSYGTSFGIGNRLLASSMVQKARFKLIHILQGIHHWNQHDVNIWIFQWPNSKSHLCKTWILFPLPLVFESLVTYLYVDKTGNFSLSFIFIRLSNSSSNIRFFSIRRIY